MRNYELLFFVDPKLEQEELEAVTGKIVTRIETGGGEMVEQKDWGVRRLAFKVADLSDGKYFLYTFRLDPAQIKPLDRQLKLAQQVVRFMIVNTEE